MEPFSYSFNELFVKQSNLIDPQPGYNGQKPGDLIYENHLNALEMALDNSWELYEGSSCDLHRILTRGVPFFEDYGASGRYRTVDVWIGHEICPSPIIIPQLMNTWFNITQKLINESIKNPLEIAWISHHMLEVIHPFIDGNGRTGRLIFNKVLTQLGEKPRIILFSDRFLYYNAINNFRENHFINNNFIDL